MSDSRMQCRMYEAKYPEVDELVMVNVRQIAEMGAYVRLLEYNNIEGMILLSELSRRRIRSIQKLIRVGRNEVAVVMRVDKEKGYIDLSKRRVSSEEIEKCEEKFTKSKAVHSIMRHVAEKSEIPLEKLYQQIGWPLYKKYGHAYEAFKTAITEPEKVFEELNIAPDVYEELISNIRRRLTPQPVKLRASIDLTCFNYDGIDAVKAALKAGEACSNEDIPIKIRLVAPPFYVITTSSLDKTQGIEIMERAIEAIQQEIELKGGKIEIKMKPKAISSAEELELAAMMERAERENAEVAGDDDADEFE